MKEVVRYGATLAVITTLAAALLAVAHLITEPKILAQMQLQEENALKEILPCAALFEAVKDADEILYYKAFDAENKYIGVAFKASAKGYSSVIETLVGMDLKGTVTAIKILNQNETPGLGSQIIEKDFSQRFIDKNAFSLTGVDAISGATITSEAVINSIKEKANILKDIING